MKWLGNGLHHSRILFPNKVGLFLNTHSALRPSANMKPIHRLNLSRSLAEVAECMVDSGILPAQPLSLHQSGLTRVIWSKVWITRKVRPQGSLSLSTRRPEKLRLDMEFVGALVSVCMSLSAAQREWRLACLEGLYSQPPPFY